MDRYLEACTLLELICLTSRLTFSFPVDIISRTYVARLKKERIDTQTSLTT